MSCSRDESDSDSIVQFPSWGTDTPIEEVERLIGEWESERARQGSMRHSWSISETINARITAGLGLRTWELDFLNYMLARLLSNVDRFAAAFKTIKGPGAPRKSKVELVLAGRRVQRYIDVGIPSESSRPQKDWDGVGAIDRVSADLNISAPKVRRGYALYKMARERTASQKLAE